MHQLEMDDAEAAKSYMGKSNELLSEISRYEIHELPIQHMSSNFHAPYLHTPSPFKITPPKQESCQSPNSFKANYSHQEQFHNTRSYSDGYQTAQLKARN